MTKAMKQAVTLAILLGCAVTRADVPVDGRAAGMSTGGVLFIGDSISYGKFGSSIDAALRTLSSRVLTESSCGTSAINWLMRPGQDPSSYTKTVCGFWRRATDGTSERTVVHVTPKIEEELAKIHAKLAVVQLGTNMAAGNPESHRASVRKMMQLIRASGSACLWIGPPDANSGVVTRSKLKITSDMIRDEAKDQGCSFIDTGSFTRFPPSPGDGIHPSSSLASVWADAVLLRLMPVAKRALAQ